MIDITVDNNQVSVDNRLYHSFNDRDALVQMLHLVIEKCLYSGESISLWVIKHDGKHVVNEWINPHVSGRYNRRYEK